MGWTYEVLAWLPQHTGEYKDQRVYAGESLIAAIRAARRAKATCGCVTFKWRG